jgi:putative ABC transport system ATP-binding protein
MIHTRQLRRDYHEGSRTVHALNGVDVDVAEGEFVAVTGPSGCGKTTLLQLIGALDTPTAGSITVGGIDLATAREGTRTRFRREQVGIVFQFFNLLPTLTVAENVALPLRLRGIATDDINGRVNALLPRVGLGDRATHLPRQLSGGEMQRVAIARAIVHQPPLLLADEPTGNLDSGAAATVMELIRELHVEQGLTLLLVTHSEEVATMAQRRIRMLDGMIA